MESEHWRHLVVLIIVLIGQCSVTHSSRILAIFPIPSISHQVAFRHLTQELARRGHEVTIITTDPAFPKGKTPLNLTEVDLHDDSYKIWVEEFVNKVDGKIENKFDQIEKSFNILANLYEKQFFLKEVQAFSKMKSNSFDLLLVEGLAEPYLVFAHIFKIPVIQISSFGAMPYNHFAIGAPLWHPILYPDLFQDKLNDLSTWDKIIKTYNHINLWIMISNAEAKHNKLLNKYLDEGAPSMSELRNHVDMLFLNIHPIWEGNFPVPPGVIYIWGIQQKSNEEIPQNLKNILDKSKNGVIYMSMGTNTKTDGLHNDKVAAFVKAFSKLPYDVIWKWDMDELPNKTDNIHIGKWFPQVNLLKHPKIKLFITQGGLQSTEEALDAGVPMIGVPMLGDQWYNVEKYVTHGIGVRLDLDDVTEETFTEAINKVIGDESYRQRVKRLHTLMRDEPQTALERAVWWTEHVLRHGGARHLRAPAANMSWVEVYEVKLIGTLLAMSIAILIGVYVICKRLIRFIIHSEKLKKS